MTRTTQNRLPDLTRFQLLTIGSGVILLAGSAIFAAANRSRDRRRWSGLAGSTLTVLGLGGAWVHPSTFVAFVALLAAVIGPICVLLWLGFEGWRAERDRDDAASEQRRLDEWGDSASEHDDENGRGEWVSDAQALAVVAPVAGMLTVGFAVGTVPPVVGIAAGGVVALGCLLPASGERWFAAVGGLYLLLTGLYLVGGPPGGAYGQSTAVACLGFGTLGIALATLRWAGKHLTKRLATKAGADGEQAAAVWQFVSAVSGLVTIIWTTITVHEKATRFGGVAGVGTLSFALGLFGVEIPVPIWFLKDGIDATIVAFVGATLAAFWTLETARSVGGFVQAVWSFYRWAFSLPVRAAKTLFT